MRAVPSVFCVGADQFTVTVPGRPTVTDDTAIENAGRAAVALPSLTRITMLLNVLAAVGVPESWPVAVLNVAHDGLLSMLNASASLFASIATGMNVYAVPTFAVVTGVPEIV